MSMQKIVRLAIICAIVDNLIGLQTAITNAKEKEKDSVLHVYVIRRQLVGQPVPSVRSFAHSALLLKTKNGKYYTLEFMSDSQAHLTSGIPREIKVDERRKVAIITMEGWGDRKRQTFEWERQLHGKALEGGGRPEELRDIMQAQMKEYSVWKEEHCHSAQERTRKTLKLLE